MIINSKELGLKLKLFYGNKQISLEQLFFTEKRIFNFELLLKGDSFEGKGIRGNDSIFIPYKKDKGIKITKDNQNIDEFLKNLLKITNIIKRSNCEIFPKIYFSKIIKSNKNNILITIMENIEKEKPKDLLKKYKSIKSFIDIRDIPYLIKNLNVYPHFLDKFYYYMEDLQFFPEDEWYKKTNLINNKIIDFGRFQILKERYQFPSNNFTRNDLLNEYKKLTRIFSKKYDARYIPQWKGVLYEGFKFDNGYTMEGYKSDHYRFDSYKKLPFIPFHKVKGKLVLDIGSNHGFFSFQSSLHGAKEVFGVELDKNNIKVANRLKKIMNLKNINFINQDITKYLFETEKQFELIIMSSVLHQIYKDLKGSDSFLEKLSNKCNYFAFETPVNFSTMNLRLSAIHKKLNKYFSVVRLVNVYKAYSKGYRANFTCIK